MFDSLPRSLPRLAGKLAPAPAPAPCHSPPNSTNEVDPTGRSSGDATSIADAETRSTAPARPHARTARGRPEEVASSGYLAWSRRREPRYHAIADRVWLQWWCDGELNGLSARLVNVSRHGAMVLAGVSLQEQQTIRVMLEDTSTDVVVESVVRGIVAGSGGLYQVHLEFETPCPDGFFEAAANGFEAWLSGSRSWV